MAHARIISIADPPGSPLPGISCDDVRHSKWIRRRRYVEKSLLPQVQRMGFHSAAIFNAIDPRQYAIEGGMAVWGDLRIPAGDYHGCFLSNYSLWKYCAAIGEAVLVLDDDARIPQSNEPYIVDCIREYESGPYSADVLYLLTAIPHMEHATRKYAPGQCKRLSRRLQRILSHGDLSGAAAYCIRPKAAEALIRRAGRIGTVAPDANMHRALMDGEIGMLAMVDDQMGVMYNDHWSKWNHDHEPGLTMENCNG